MNERVQVLSRERDDLQEQLRVAEVRGELVHKRLEWLVNAVVEQGACPQYGQQHDCWNREQCVTCWQTAMNGAVMVP